MISSNPHPANQDQPLPEKIQNRLQNPEIADGLVRLLDRIDSIAFAVEAFEGFIARGDTIIESVADAVKEAKGIDASPMNDLIRQAPDWVATGTKMAASSQRIDFDSVNDSNVLQRLSDPETLKTLNQLLDHLPLIAFLVESLDGFIGRGDTIIDSVTSMVHDLKGAEGSIDLEKIKSIVSALPKLQLAGEQLLNSELMGDNMEKVIGAGVQMIESGMLDRQVVNTLGDLGRKSVDTYNEVNQQPVPPISGIWAMLKASRDPDVQKTLGFAVAFAKAFAKHLK